MFSKGIAFALAACLIWGLIFVIPQFMTGFTPIEIATGRYFVYGMISAIFSLQLKKYPLKIWLRALFFSLICSYGYYIFVILSLRYSTPAICTLILGISPIAISFYGNWRERECSYRSLFLPSLLILAGLLIINAPHIMVSTTPSTYLIGLLCALWAMAGWSWYVVVNSAFLKKTPEISSSDWSTLIGVSTLFWVAVFVTFASLFMEGEFELRKFITPGADLTAFLLGSAVLGIICSWMGCFLWNKASLYLPVSLAGQLTLFETIFGISYVYMLEQRLPPLIELLGVVFMLAAITYGIRATSKVVTYSH